MAAEFQVSGRSQAALFTLKLHRGDGMALVAMNWKDGRPPDDFVGFGIEYKEPGGDRFYALKNRLAFAGSGGKVNPNSLSSLRRNLEKRLNHDHESIKIVTADQSNAQRYARKLLHRLSQSLGFALMCERAAEDERFALTAIRYHEEIEPPAIGGEDPKVHYAALELIDDEVESQSVGTG